MNNNWMGVAIDKASYDAVSGNSITYNSYGVYSIGSHHNIISRNNLMSNDDVFYLTGGSYDNWIFHNNFIGNSPNQAWVTGYSWSIWDDCYPSGGNYRSDYTGVNEKSGPNQDQLGSDGMEDDTFRPFFTYSRQIPVPRAATS